MSSSSSGGSVQRAAPCSCPRTCCTRSSAWRRASSSWSTGASWPRARRGAIRDLIRDRPRTLRIAAGASAQALARELVGEGLASGVRIDTGVLVVETADVDALGRRLMPLARDLGVTLDRVEPLGDDLESVYTYLTDHARGRGR